MSALENNVWVQAWLVLALWQGLMFLVQVWHRNAAVVDFGWAFGMGFLAILLAARGEGDATRRLCVAILGGLWGLRLSWHLLVHRVLIAEEDGRYADLRTSWGGRAQINFFLFFQVQAAWSLLFALPFHAAIENPQPWGSVFDWLAVAVWLTAVLGESVADAQLSRWKRMPDAAGRTCRLGLWRYSRHPNYFFEWVHWWAYVLLAWGGSKWALAWLGPLAMLFFLWKVTGIPYTEQRALASRGDDYRRYQQTTSAFFPWFPGDAPPSVAGGHVLPSSSVNVTDKEQSHERPDRSG